MKYLILSLALTSLSRAEDKTPACYLQMLQDGRILTFCDSQKDADDYAKMLAKKEKSHD